MFSGIISLIRLPFRKFFGVSSIEVVQATPILIREAKEALISIRELHDSLTIIKEVLEDVLDDNGSFDYRD